MSSTDDGHGAVRGTKPPTRLLSGNITRSNAMFCNGTKWCFLLQYHEKI